jgi:Domain of unknown function (DUF4386)
MVESSQPRSTEATRRLARRAGAAYLLLGALTMFGFYHAPLVRGDLSALARVLTRAGELRFRIGVVADVLAAAAAVPLAVLLYRLFRPVQRTNAAVMALLLLVPMPVSFVVALDYVAARWFLTGAPIVAAIPGAEREALGMLFLSLHAHGVLAVEIFWGLWLLPFGLLVIRSGFLPRVLGVLLVIGSVAYVAHSITSLLLGGARFAAFEDVTMVARAAAEFPIMLWLLVRGAGPRKAGLGAV